MKTTENIIIGQNLQFARERIGYSRKYAAQVTGLTGSRLRNIERGAAAHYSEVVKCAEVYKVKPESVLCENPDWLKGD